MAFPSVAQHRIRVHLAVSRRARASPLGSRGGSAQAKSTTRAMLQHDARWRREAERRGDAQLHMLATPTTCSGASLKAFEHRVLPRVTGTRRRVAGTCEWTGCRGWLREGLQRPRASESSHGRPSAHEIALMVHDEPPTWSRPGSPARAADFGTRGSPLPLRQSRHWCAPLAARALVRGLLATWRARLRSQRRRTAAGEVLRRERDTTRAQAGRGTGDLRQVTLGAAAVR